MQTRKIIGLTIIFSFTLFGATYKDIEWSSDYVDAVTSSEIKHRPVMVLVTSPQCKWCNKFKNTTLSDDEVVARLNAKFITVELTKGESNYPQNILKVRAVPTIYFIDSDGDPIMKPVVGYWDIENFQSYLDDAERKAQ
jgi:protein disulfide-isomerase